MMEIEKLMKELSDTIKITFPTTTTKTTGKTAEETTGKNKENEWAKIDKMCSKCGGYADIVNEAEHIKLCTNCYNLIFMEKTR